MSGFFNYIREQRNPYLIFLPFLFIYIILVFIFQTDVIIGDEERYISYATHLTQGYYAPADLTLGHGPGYSIVLAPFIALKLPLVLVKLLNAFFHYFSIIFLFKACREYVSFGLALAFGIFWACYFNTLVYLHLMYSEIIASFLVTWFLYYFIKVFKSEDRKTKNKYAWGAGLVFGFLILTKVVFGYVLLFMLGAVLIIWFFSRRKENYKYATLVLVASLIAVSPYLIYTFKLTGKMFYWSTTGGENLYWMTTDHEGEYGTWFPVPTVNDHGSDNNSGDSNVLDFTDYANMVKGDNWIPGIADSIRIRHLEDFQEVFRNSETGVERDAAFTRIAIRNIRANPRGYINNCISNVGRILFNYPYSYATQRPATLLRLPLNGIIAILALFCLLPTLLNWRRMIFPLRFLLLFTGIYLGGSVLGSAEIRMFSLIVPILFLWIAYILDKCVKKIVIRW